MICVKWQCLSVQLAFERQFYYFTSYMITLPKYFTVPNYLVVNHYLHYGSDAMICGMAIYFRIPLLSNIKFFRHLEWLHFPRIVTLCMRVNSNLFLSTNVCQWYPQNEWIEEILDDHKCHCSNITSFYSLSGKTYLRQIPWSLEVLSVIMIVSLWNSTSLNLNFATSRFYETLRQHVLSLCE